jgi:hypothetical protein
MTKYVTVKLTVREAAALFYVSSAIPNQIPLKFLKKHFPSLVNTQGLRCFTKATEKVNKELANIRRTIVMRRVVEGKDIEYDLANECRWFDD